MVPKRRAVRDLLNTAYLGREERGREVRYAGREEERLRGVGRGLRVYGVNMNSTDCGPRVLGLLWPWTLMQSQFSDNWYDTLSISYEINIIQSNCALHECLQLLVFALTT